MADLVADALEPPILLLDSSGARSATQLGGLPPRYHSKDAAAYPHNRSYLGYSSNSRWFTASLIQIQEEEPTATFVWDLQSPSRPVARLELGSEGSAPTISADGRRLYSAQYEGGGHLRVTELPSGKTRRALTPSDLGVRQLDDVMALSPDGRTLAVGAGVDVVLVDTDSLTPRARLSGQGDTTALAFSPDGTHLAASGDRLVVWDLSGREPVQTFVQDGDADDPGFSRDAKTLYTGTFPGLVQAWDLAGGRRFLPAAPPGDRLDWPEPVTRFSPDLRKIGYVAVAPQFRVRDVDTGRLGAVVAPTMTQANVDDLAWHPDGSTLNITSGAEDVRTWDSTTGRQLAQRRLGPPGSGEGAQIAWFSLDGKYLLVGTTKGRIHVLDAHTLVPIRDPIQVYKTKEGDPSPQEIGAFRPSGDLRTLWIRDAIVDYLTGAVRPMPKLGFQIEEVYPSSDGKRLLVNVGPAGVGLLDATTMQWISRPNAGQAGLVGDNTKWSDDGSRVASVSDGHLSQWDGRRGYYLGTATVGTNGDPAFSKDESRLLFAGADGSVRSWDLDPASWVAAACRLAGRPLTEQEWSNYLPDRPFQRVCAH